MECSRLKIKIPVIMVSILLMGLLLMIGVYMLPTGRMKAHIANSDDTFNYEGIFPQLMQGYKSSQLDNFTDTLMYATAIHEGSGNAVQDAMRNARYEYENNNMAQSLNDYANDASGMESLRYEVHYSRYWHGYLVILKPLLLMFEVGEIRMMNMIVQGSMVIALFYLIRKKLGERYQLPVMVMLAVLNPVVLPLSLQFSWVYYISLGGAIWLLSMDNPFAVKKYVLLFLIIGMLTSYLDLLTYPLITLGLPVVLLVLLDCNSGGIQRTIRMMESAFVWGIGYAVMWMGKWLFAWLLGGDDIWKDAIAEVLLRTSMAGDQKEMITFGMVLERNFQVLLKWPYLLLAALFVSGCLWLKRMERGEKESRKHLIDVMPYVLIMLMPIVWFCVLSNHSWLHYWFTYRELAVTVLAVCAAVMELWVPKHQMSLKERNKGESNE